MYARLLQLPRPTADRLAVYLHPPRHLRLAEPLAQPSRRLHPPPLQGREVPPHARWISHALHINRNQYTLSLSYARIDSSPSESEQPRFPFITQSDLSHFKDTLDNFETIWTLTSSALSVTKWNLNEATIDLYHTPITPHLNSVLTHSVSWLRSRKPLLDLRLFLEKPRTRWNAGCGTTVVFGSKVFFF